ncbi:DUF2510 domain-containing protein [Microbacterium sp. Marseille-Q6965]|uniref:DUF2510 domain-containing protein n=1 Tax=Microbacterium sp. Marseille-Q6965 TaxID=2965072 RepID=UPI0021B7559B|nr:DUF2510 domain-containing protein [Microbacterium sp. Marseille-Q6965]
MTTGQTPPPGWYPSERPGLSRYWDGVRWTEHYHPSGPRPAAPGSVAPGAYAGDPRGGHAAPQAFAPHGVPAAAHTAAMPYGGVPGYGPTATAPRPRKRWGAGATIAIVLAAILVLGGGGLGIAALSGAFGPAAEQSADDGPARGGGAEEPREGGTADDDGADEPADEVTDAAGSAQEQCETGEGRHELLTALTVAVSTSAFTEHPMDVTFGFEYLDDVCAVAVTAMPATSAEFNGNDMLGLLSLVITYADQIPDYATHVHMYGVDGSTGDRFSLADSFAELGGDPAGVTPESGIGWPLDTLVG